MQRPAEPGRCLDQPGAFDCNTVIFAAGLGKTLLAPDEIDYYENRYANQVAALSAASYLDASFQDSMEDALADQVQLSTTAKRPLQRRAGLSDPEGLGAVFERAGPVCKIWRLLYL